MSQVYEDYLQYLEDLADTLEQMAEVTKAKNKAARAGDLVTVESLMKKEQVFSMTLRGMDIKRDKMLAEMGLQGVPLSKLAENYPLAIKVAVMGCAVNGPGEAKEADIGIAGGIGEGLLIKKGEIVRKVPEQELLDTLLEELLHWNE